MACMNRQPEIHGFFIRDTSYLTTSPQCYSLQARQIQEAPRLMLHKQSLLCQGTLGPADQRHSGTMFFLMYFSTWAEAWASEVRKEVIITANQPASGPLR